MQWDWKVLVGIVVVAVAVGWLLTRTVHEPDVDLPGTERDLEELAQALRADQGAEIEIIPPIASGIQFPSSLPYRRATDFWRPVLGETRLIRGGARRRPR